MSAAIVAGIVVAGAGAYAANQAKKGAKEANKQRNTTTDQTSESSNTSRSIYDVDPFIAQLLGESQSLYGQAKTKQQARDAGTAAAAANPLAAFPAGAQARPDGRVILNGKTIGNIGPQAGAKTPKASKNKGGTNAGPAAPAGPSRPQSASDYFRAGGDIGLGIGDDPLYGAGSSFINQLLGINKPAGGDQGDPSQNALAYNPVAQDLDRRLRGSSLDENDDLIRQFLGIGGGGAYGGGQGGAGAPRGGRGGSSSGYSRDANGVLQGGPAAGGVPDTSRGGGQFNDELARIFDPSRLDPANDPTMQPMLDAIRREAEKGLTNSLWDLDAQTAGAGRYGSDAAAFARGAAQNEFGDTLNNAISSTLFSSREANLGRVMQALGLRNERDMGAMADATQREGIRASSAASGAGLDLQRELANRGMDLEAIGMLTQNNQFGINQLAGLAGQLSGDKMGALGMIPDLLGVRLSGAQVANQSGQGLLNKSQGDAQINASRSAANAALNEQRRQFDLTRGDRLDMGQEDALNRYLGRIATIAGLGTTTSSTDHTTGTNVVPGAGINANAAGVNAGLGTAAGLAGLLGMFSGGGSSFGGGTTPPPSGSQYGGGW